MPYDTLLEILQMQVVEQIWSPHFNDSFTSCHMVANRSSSPRP
jgi:hypothetical protein